MQVNVRYLRFNEMDIPIINIDGNDFLTSGDFGRICGVVRTNLTNIMRMGMTFTYNVGGSKEIDYVIQRSNPKSRFSRLIDLGVRYPILNSIRLKTPFSLFISKYEEMSGLSSNVIQIAECGESRFGIDLLHEVYQTLAVDFKHACSKMRSRFREECPDCTIVSVCGCESSMDAMIAVVKNELNEK